MSDKAAKDWNKAMLLSVKPQYANLLVDGIKTIELRRRFPLDLPHDQRCLIYSSSPMKAVIGECRIKEVIKLDLEKLWKAVATEAMVSWDDFVSYFDGLDSGYAVYMYKHQRYPESVSLPKIKNGSARPPQSYQFLEPPVLEAAIM